MKLALFFSRGVSLELWLNKGLFDREKLLYEEHLKLNNVEKVYWFTYGCQDKKIADQLYEKKQLHRDIIVVGMPYLFNIPKVGSYIYSIFLSLIHGSILRQCDIYKTNQTDGSWSAVIAKHFYSKKLLYRTGYTISQLENKLQRFNTIVRKFLQYVEYIGYKNCDRATVSSQDSLEYILDKYSLDIHYIDVVYNYIDRRKFYDFRSSREQKVVLIGRLSREKNIVNLIKALQYFSLPLEIYGSGSLEKDLEVFIKNNNCDVKLMGNIGNNELPKILNKSKYFALVSEHEGMPKALIEGMACGCICIGTDVSGIKEVIVGKNGILADGTSSEEIKKAFKEALGLSKECELKLKHHAEIFIDSTFTLDSVIKKEMKIFKDLAR